MNASQRTLASAGEISGIGLHTGKPSTLRFRPSSTGNGLRFFRGNKQVGGFASDIRRCTAVGEGAERILTVEHLLAAVRGMGITNLSVEIEGPEVPGLDGSALGFVELFRRLGVQNQAAAAEVYRVREPIFCYDRQKAIAIYPSESFSVSYTLDYDHPHLKEQTVELTLDPGTFESRIAPARTFCTEEEAAQLQASGFGLGCTRENTVVVARDGSHKASLRFPDECARHKVLDLIGDLALLGFAVAGRVVAVRSGHELNRKLVQAIQRQKEEDR